MDQGQTHITLFDSDVSYLKTSYPRFEIPFFYLLKEHLHFTLSFPWESPQTWLSLDPSAPAQWYQGQSPGSHSPAKLDLAWDLWSIPVPKEVPGGRGWGCPGSTSSPDLGWRWAETARPYPDALHGEPPSFIPQRWQGEMLCTSQCCLELERNTCKNFYVLSGFPNTSILWYNERGNLTS